MDILYNTNFNYAPVTIESVNFEWIEDHPIIRKEGFPYLLYLKTFSGSGKVKINGKNLILSEGRSILISPLVPYTYEAISTEVWKTDFFSISGDFVPSIPSILEYNNYLFIAEDHAFDANRMIRHWYHMLLDNDKIVNYLQLSVDVLSFFIQLKTRLDRTADTNLYIYKKYVKSTLDFIQKNYQNTLVISQLASLVNVSPQYLSRLYKVYFGISPQQYLINYRITQAKNKLIQYPDLSITEIALETGFKTSSHFIEKFRALTGYTPKKYRDFHYSGEKHTPKNE